MPGPWGPHFDQGDHVIVVGLQGTGKSYFVKRLAMPARRVVFFDVKGDYLVNGTPVPPVALEDPELLTRPRVRLAIQAGRDPGVDVADEFRYVIRKLRESGATEDRGGAGNPGVLLVADELNLYASRCGLVLNSLMANGHKDGIVDVLISQRGVDAPLGCRALLTRAYAFKQKHPRDLERLEEEFGPEFMAAARDWQAHRPPAMWEQERFYR
jgi:hypothetical protein